ncbi:MAG TPA: glycoside hydrolase family 25 protein [Candidatus Paceibacterota bacterium]|nr:glycoside hydrolase family 25 protein [Candidatus Paceibacterota bacterium]
MKYLPKFFLIMSIVVGTLSPLPALATSSKLTLSIRQTPSVSDPVITLYGQLKPARKSVKINVQVELSNKWQNTLFSTTTTSKGTWKIEAVATALDAQVKYRAIATLGSSKTFSSARSIRISQIPEMSNYDPSSLILETGPGGRIHGMDISRWQHPGGAPIDFEKMYAAGVRFVMIKAADSHDIADAEALKYLIMDRNAAQAVGIYTGFYYYATLPDTTDEAVIIEDAQAQAQKAIWRLASLGGYTDRDLSFALDLENNCVRKSTSGSCTKYTSRSAVTLWAKTWLEIFAAKTNRTPIIYSYPQFLENAMVRDASFASYPLWIAHYSLNPFDPLSQPGLKTAGCFVTPWTTANCSSLWAVWQYTSCGIAKKYGVPGTRVDLNVFRGTPSSFLDLAKGTWAPESADLMPVLEPTQMVVTPPVVSKANKPILFSIDVNRPTGLPVVTGTVKFVADKIVPPLVGFTQNAVRSSSGRWTLTLKSVPAGLWSGRIIYNDLSGTHAKSTSAVTLEVSPGPTPSPSPTPSTSETDSPTPSPTAKPKPTPTKRSTIDYCRYQVKN